jgi:xanthine dehydrogenase accessory factor
MRELTPPREVTVTDDDTEALPRPRAAGAIEVLALAARLLEEGHDVALATVLARRGSAPGTPGQKLALASDQTCAGTVGGGALERAVLRALSRTLDAMSRGDLPDPSRALFNLGSSLGMCCGGSVEVLVEPLGARVAVGVVGAGHIASALVPMLARAGFAVTVTDEREDWADPKRLPDATVLAGSYRELFARVARRGAVLVMTHQHQLDQEAVEWALKEGYAFVGGVGSRAKIARTRARLEAKGFSAEDVARVRMPLGVAIGARLPEEIAVSIAAELIAWRRGANLPREALLQPTRDAE